MHLTIYYNSNIKTIFFLINTLNIDYKTNYNIYGIFVIHYVELSYHLNKTHIHMNFN